jgi:beta-xylosidase
LYALGNTTASGEAILYRKIVSQGGLEMIDHRERAKVLIEKMNIKEKVAQLHAVWLNIEEDGSFAFRRAYDGFIEESSAEPGSILKHGIGQITRPLGTRPIDAASCVRGLNRIQKYLVEQTRLKIPALAHEECLPGLMAKGATLFPAAINFGSLWDEELMREIAAAIGKELYSVGARQGLAPVADVSRDVRWGRTEESFGEDPYLAGCMTTAYVRGLQGENRRVLATLKHFAGHSFSEGARNHAPVRIGERELNDVFLLPFEMAVKLADAGSVMPAYHDIDGEPLSSSRRCITEILRELWGFDGLVVSDYEAVRLLYAHHGIARDEAEAAAQALQAGIDVELPGFTCFGTGVEEALSRGILKMSTIDEAVIRVLVEKSRLGLFENPYVEEGAITLNTPEHRKIAAEAAARSMVLLKNDGMLPLQDEGTTAVIGPLADDQLALFCGYSFPVHLIRAQRLMDSDTRYAQTLREAMDRRASAGKILYSRGCQIFTERLMEAPVFPGDAEAGQGQKNSTISMDESGFDDALSIASKADRIIAAVGDLSGLFLTGTVGEGSDASSLTLPGVQQKLVDALLSLGKPTVIVLLSGRPYNLGDAFSKANAVIEAWFPGQEGGAALAAILYGDINPGGRLPVSFPKSAGAMPYFYNHKVKSAGSPIHPDFGAVFPFGYGLSYTNFEYSDFQVSHREIQIDGQIEISCTVKNTGERAGDEVVQLYVRDPIARLVRPVKELKGFKRLGLNPGERKKVTFTLPVDLLGYTISGTTRIVEPGEVQVMIGRSSEEILFSETIEVAGKPRELPKRWKMKTDTVVDVA